MKKSLWQQGAGHLQGLSDLFPGAAVVRFQARDPGTVYTPALGDIHRGVEFLVRESSYILLEDTVSSRHKLNESITGQIPIV